MFYTETPDNQLRFGDVLLGPISAALNIEETFIDNRTKDFRIDFIIPVYSVILTPCCSIDNDKVAVAPLLQLRPALFRNPYFRQDFTRINREMEPQQAVPPDVWESLTREEQVKRIDKGRTYSFLEVFVFQGHELLEDYKVRDRTEAYETNSYMVDFRDSHRMNKKKAEITHQCSSQIKMPSALSRNQTRPSLQNGQLLRTSRGRRFGRT
jgi:hypothetical protein